MRCDKCKFWELDKYDITDPLKIGYCNRVELFWDCTTWGDLPNGEFGRILTEKAKNNKAFVQDGSDYSASLLTAPDFGCIQFEASRTAIENHELEKCPRCGSDAAVDFEEHMIYCTGCPLSVQDTEIKFSQLLDIWNDLKTSIN